MGKLNICIDIDGTITNPYHFIPYLNDMYNKQLTESECITHKLEELYEVDLDDLLKSFHTDYIHAYKEASVVEGAKEVIKDLNENHNLYFVTARSEILKDITKVWLNENELGYIDVHLLGSDYKVSKARELECNIFIEDNPSNAMQLASEGLTVLLIDNNYNKDIENENIIRVSSWNDIKEFILSLK
jgi:uncharacterized protein